MPILERETTCWPSNLFQETLCHSGDWFAFYTRPRQEKKLCRFLLQQGTTFYCPSIERKYRSPNGKLRRSYLPLFPNYVFGCCEEQDRYAAICSSTISRAERITDATRFIEELGNLYRLILIGKELTPESKLAPGTLVRVKSGVFQGFEGTLIRRENETRLLVSVSYMGRGASVALDDCQVEAI